MTSEIVMIHFFDELSREKAPCDPLIRARAPVDFVLLYVIVPELAVELVMEDMQLGWDRGP